MMAFKYLGFLLVALILLILFNSTSFCQSDKPNILVIMADDLGYGDLSCFGSEKIETPVLDKLANNGLKLNQFYAGGPLCTPTRAAYLTGLFPIRFGIDDAFRDRKGQFLPDTTLSIPKVLKSAGYFTAHIGKWHLGGVREEDFVNRQKGLAADPGPVQHGFDYYLSNIEEFEHRGKLYHGDSIYKSAGFHMVRNDQFATPIDKWWDEIKVDEAIKLMDSCSRSNTPFFVSLCLFTPHVPYEPPPGPFLEQYIRKGAQGYDLLYRSMVSYMDFQIGRLIETLTLNGNLENTLIIFTSDNGPYVEGSVNGMKGRKFDLHEGGIKVPTIVYWPKQIQGGTSSNAPYHITDLLPTFAAVAGGSTKGIELDGQDVSQQWLKGEGTDHKMMFWHQPLIKGYPAPDEKYQFLYSGSTKLNAQLSAAGKPTPYSTEAIRKGDWKLYVYEGKPVELVNIKDDPKEEKNLLGNIKKIEEDLMKDYSRIMSSKPEKQQDTNKQ